MQTFKQYLLENTNYPIAKTYLNLDAYNNSEKDFEHTIKELYKQLNTIQSVIKPKIDIQDNGHQVQITFEAPLKSTQECLNIEKYMDEVFDISTEFGDVDSCFTFISCVWPPPFQIKTIDDYDIQITINEPNTEILNNIKLINNVHELSIENVENLTGVLSILKIPNISSVSFIPKNKSLLSDFTVAEKIINKYLNGTKDIWKCQDELQDNNLDEYADL